MKLYKYDSKKVKYCLVPRSTTIFAAIFIFLIGVLLGWCIYYYSAKKEPSVPFSYEEMIVLIDNVENELVSPRAIYEYMKEVGIRYPEIVWSQAALESRFSSNICKQNNNYFGMKRALRRPNLQTGENLNHATYRNWKMSVLDYAIWQAAAGVHKFKNEAAYFNYLNQYYAEDEQYAIKVKTIRDNFDFYLDSYEKKFKKGELK